MKRLSSYFTYVQLIMGPLIQLILIYIYINYKPGFSMAAIIGLVIVFGFIAYAYFFITLKSKRIFYNDGSIYAYSLFSKDFISITKDNLRYIGAINILDKTNFKIVYYDYSGNLKKIYFVRNMFIENFSDIVSELNS